MDDQQLMMIPVRVLKQFFTAFDIPVSGSVEKKDLILLLRNSPITPERIGYYKQHLDQVRVFNIADRSGPAAFMRNILRSPTSSSSSRPASSVPQVTQPQPDPSPTRPVQTAGEIYQSESTRPTSYSAPNEPDVFDLPALSQAFTSGVENFTEFMDTTFSSPIIMEIPTAHNAPPASTNRAHSASPARSPTRSQPAAVGIPLSSLINYTRDTIKSLNTRVLTQILRDNRVNAEGVKEKDELIARVMTLVNNERVDRNIPLEMSPVVTEMPSVPVSDEELCKICFDNRSNAVLLECGHLCACIDCAKQLKECPVC